MEKVVVRRHQQDVQGALGTGQGSRRLAEIDPGHAPELGAGDERAHFFVRADEVQGLTAFAESDDLMLALLDHRLHDPLDRTAWINQDDAHGFPAAAGCRFTASLLKPD